MDQIRAHLLLAASVLLGSAIPFVPTGEMVSGAAAVAVHSRLNDLLIFAICFACSVLGDLIMLAEARLFAPRLRRALAGHRLGQRVDQAQQALTRNVFSAVVTGRLIPGGRTPVIAALGLSRMPVRRFLAADVVACALWAAIYSTLGSIGGRIAHHPVWAMVIAIAFAVSVGLGVQQVVKIVHWLRTRRSPAASTPENVSQNVPENAESGAEPKLRAGR